jgi:DNA-directed RNA polymerase subunit M/transcription elongation factor TFIIS
MESIRKIGIDIISRYSTKKKNVVILEEEVWKKSKCIEDYKQNLYDLIGIMITSGMNKAYKYIKNVRSMEGIERYDCDEYSDIIQNYKEEDEYILNPISIEEGVNTCNKCKSKRTISYSRQTRSADEGTTVFCVCGDCGAKWKM